MKVSTKTSTKGECDQLVTDKWKEINNLPESQCMELKKWKDLINAFKNDRNKMFELVEYYEDAMFLDNFDKLTNHTTMNYIKKKEEWAMYVEGNGNRNMAMLFGVRFLQLFNRRARMVGQGPLQFPSEAAPSPFEGLPEHTPLPDFPELPEAYRTLPFPESFEIEDIWADIGQIWWDR